MIRQSKQLWAIAIAVGVVGGVIACTGDEPTTAPSEESTLLLPPDDGTGSGPLGVLNPIELLSPSCNAFGGSQYTSDVKAKCVEVWGEYLVDMNDQFTDPPKYQCKAYGHPPANTQIGFPSDWVPVWTPTNQTNSLSHSFTIKGHRNNAANSWMPVNATDAARFKGEGTPWRPSNPGEYATVTCTVDGVSAVGEVWIVGNPLELASINIVVPKSTIVIGEQTQLTPEFFDNYNFKNDLVPAPTVTSWESSATGTATVSSTGLVTGIGRGTAQITATATRGSVTKTKVISLTVIGCTLTTSPSGTVDLWGFGTLVVNATKACDSGASIPLGNWIWTSDNPYNGVKVYGNNPTGTQGLLSAEMPGTSQIRVCTPAGTGATCSPYITARVKRTTVTSGQSGTVQYPGMNASGTMPFTVTNTGPVAASGSITCSGSNVVNCTGISPTTFSLNAGQSVNVTASWTTGTTTGTGELNVAAGTGYGGVGFTVNGGAVAATIFYGPDNVKPGAMCEWMSSANGGTVPYTYQWFVDGNPVSGAGNDLVYTNAISSGSSFQLSVTVTDASMATNTAYKTVSVSSSAPTCVQ